MLQAFSKLFTPSTAREKARADPDMNAEEVTAGLNEMAGKSSPRKRVRLSSHDEPSPSAKRIAPQTPASETPQDSPRTRSGRLKRPTPKMTTPEVRNRKDAFALPEQHSPEKLPVQKPIKKPLRKLNAVKKQTTGNPSPFRGTEFGTVDPLKATKATLTSVDSPAKHTRSKQLTVTLPPKPAENPLDALKEHPIIPQPMSPKAAQSTPKSPGRPRKVKRGPKPDSKSSLRHSQTLEPGNADDESGNPKLRTERSEEENDSELVADNTQRTRLTQDEPADPSANEQKSKKKGRKAMSEEEKQRREEEKKVEQAKRMKEIEDNAMESEKAENERFQLRRKKYMRGIEDGANAFSLYDQWADMGAAALSITATVPKVEEMGSERAQTVWTKIMKLRKGFDDLLTGTDDVTGIEKRITDNAQKFRNRADVRILRVDNTRDPKTGRELYQYLIPGAIMVLKKALQARYSDNMSVESFGQIVKLLRSTRDLCIIAQDWEPRPTTLESGIMRHVQWRIRPSLDALYKAYTQIGMSVARGKQNEIQRHKLAERQKAKLEAIMQRTLYRHEKKQDVIDIDDVELDSGDDVQTVDKEQPRLTRERTEEIPAPSDTIWTQKEKIALLEGLQRFQESDRYTKILDRFSEELGTKDLDQLVNQAQFIKHSCQQAMNESETRGEGERWNWLRTVAG